MIGRSPADPPRPPLSLSLQKALHVRAVRAFKDIGGRERRTGEEWLVTLAEREAHVPSVAEEVVGVVEVTTLSRRQYCVVLDPVGPDGKPQLGQKKVVKVGSSFRSRKCTCNQSRYIQLQ